MPPDISDIADIMAKGNFKLALSRGTKLAQKIPDNPRLFFMLGAAAFQLEKYDQAIEHFTKADTLHPDAAEIKNNLGAVLMHNGNLEEAVPVLEQALVLKPNYTGAEFNLAITHKKRGAFDMACTLLEKTRRAQGDSEELLLELVDVYHALARWRSVASVCQALINNKNENPEIHLRSIEALIKTGNIPAAEKMADPFFNKPTATAEIAEIGDFFNKAGQAETASRFYNRVLENEPTNQKARIGLGDVYRRGVHRWHFTMLNDSERNEAYDAAIRRAVKPGDIVLDIGSGSGLLAMMAARAGAAHVYSCEAVPIIAKKARQIVAANGLSDQITILSKLSFNMKIGTDMPKKANVLISEIVDGVLVGEGILPTLNHALSELVEPDAAILPASGRLFLTVIESEEVYLDERASTASGFDVSAFNEFTLHGTSLIGSTRGNAFRELGPVIEAFNFDFTKPGFKPEEHQICLPVDQDGTVHGVLIWFDMALDSEVMIDNHPKRDNQHWGFFVKLLDKPIKKSSGEDLGIIISHDMTAIDVRILDKP